MKKKISIISFLFLTSVIYAAYPISFNEQTVNSKVIGEAPATSMALLYQSLAHSTGIIFANAVNQQQQMSVSSNATSTEGINQIFNLKGNANVINENNQSGYTDSLSPIEKEYIRNIIIQQLEILDIDDYALSLLMLNREMLKIQGKASINYDAKILDLIDKVNTNSLSLGIKKL